MSFLVVIFSIVAVLSAFMAFSYLSGFMQAPKAESDDAGWRAVFWFVFSVITAVVLKRTIKKTMGE